jgi:hypothetical protein
MANTKKIIILNCIRLGMDFYTAALSASCTKKEIEELEQNEEFQSTIEINQAILEKDLLEQHDRVSEIASERGQAAPLQWKLERVNPSRWGGRTKIETDKPLVGELTINMVRGKG